MATRNEVLTLFGATPEQIRAKQMREQAATLQQIRDPYQQTGTAIGMALGRMFGGKTQEELDAERLQQAQQGINLSTAEGMEAAAQRLQEMGFTNRALQLYDVASRKKTADQTRELGQIKIVNKPIQRTVEYTDEFGDKKSKVVTINWPHRYNMLTGAEPTPLFDAKELENALVNQAKLEDSVADKRTTQSEDRVRKTIEQEINEIPIGGIYTRKSDGQRLRRTPDGWEPITQKQIDEEAGITEDQMRGF